MGQFCCSNSVGVAIGVGHSLWAGLGVHRLHKLDRLLPVDDLLPVWRLNWRIFGECTFGAFVS